MFNVNQSVARILTDLPEAREFFSIKKLPCNPEHKMAAQVSLKNMLRFKRIDEGVFLRELDKFIDEQKQVLHEGAGAGIEGMVQNAVVMEGYTAPRIAILAP
jgi:hypothetical protein